MLISRLFLSIFVFLSFLSITYAKEKVVFIINTAEHDSGGGVTTPYLDEYEQIQQWQKIMPEAKVLRIRADSNEGVRRGLSLWMGQNPEEKEVVGLYIRSHGNRAAVMNESGKFRVQLPKGLNDVFQPIQGHFADQARIVFDGCSLLEGMPPQFAGQYLEAIRQSFGLTSGYIYANKVKGSDFIKTLLKTDPLNKDISIQNRLTAVGMYSVWPVSFPTLAAMDHYYNRGYVLQIQGDDIKIFSANYRMMMAPSLQHLNHMKPVATPME